MVRAGLKIVGLCVLVVAGSAGVYLYYNPTDRRIQKLEEEKKELQQIVQRLGTERRRAEILVTEQKTIDGVLRTTLLFVEYARDGSTLPPKVFTIEGKFAHIDSLVIQFDREFVQQADPLRGHTIILFDKIFGDKQSPADAFRIDEPGRIPAIYRGVDPRVSQFEQELWNDFWQLVDDPAERQKRGVRVAQGDSKWGPFEPGKIYTVTVDAAGGVNLTSEPLKGAVAEWAKTLIANPDPAK